MNDFSYLIFFFCNFANINRDKESTVRSEEKEKCLVRLLMSHIYTYTYIPYIGTHDACMQQSAMLYYWNFPE